MATTNEITDEVRTEIEQLAALLHKHKDRVAVLSPFGDVFAAKSLSHAVQDAGIIIRCELAGLPGSSALTIASRYV